MTFVIFWGNVTIVIVDDAVDVPKPLVVVNENIYEVFDDNPFTNIEVDG